MASTNSNQFSSRSHAIIQIFIENKNEKTKTTTFSKLYLIDLAGNEKACTNDKSGLRNLEGSNINKSLLSLANCITILSDSNKKGGFVPYRDSKLTRLLKDSLGGNTKTFMLTCISPFFGNYEETINTLKYASRAGNIKKKICKNLKDFEEDYKEFSDNIINQISFLKEKLNSCVCNKENFNDKLI